MKKPGNVALGERVRHLRADILGLSQEDFGERLGVTRGAVGNWELGKGVSRPNIEQILESFQVCFDWLVQGVGPVYPKEESIDVLLDKLPPEESEYLYEVAAFMIELRLRLVAMRKANIASAEERQRLLSWSWERPEPPVKLQ